MSNYKTYGEWCAEIPPYDPRSEILNSWRQSAYEQNKRIAELEAKLKVATQYEILVKLRAGEGTWMPLQEVKE